MHIIYSSQHQRHATEHVHIHGQPFNEVPARAEVILAALHAARLGPIHPPTDHGLDPLVAAHDPGYVNFLQRIYAEGEPYRHRMEPGAPFMGDTFTPRLARRRSAHPWAQIGHYSFDVETPFLEGTWEAAYWSAQCALTAADRVLSGEHVAYALCRPPGHHASLDQCGGFCYLNNAAIAARYLQFPPLPAARKRGPGAREKVAILDIDYHHGNGTQEIFYSDPTVLYVSLHAHPDNDYPFFWGAADERGDGLGEGFNLNLPLPRRTGDAEYLAALDQALAAIRNYGPRYVIVSAGFDIAQNDPSALGAGFAVSTDGFRAIGERIAALNVPLLIVQEGGYRLGTLGENALAFLGALE